MQVGGCVRQQPQEVKRERLQRWELLHHGVCFLLAYQLLAKIHARVLEFVLAVFGEEGIRQRFETRRLQVVSILQPDEENWI